MRIRYNNDLKSIKEMSSELMELVVISYDRLDLYLDKKNKDNLKQVIELQDDIRRGAGNIERFCFELLALQQPVASDLMFLQMEIKYSSTIKRIASHLVSVSQILQEYSVKEEEIVYLKKFIENQKKMARNGIKAFTNNDHSLALKTIENDEINNNLFTESITYSAKENKENRITAIELSNKILLFKYFERLGDRLARVANLATRL